jgi:uncharacterized membrane protein
MCQSHFPGDSIRSTRGYVWQRDAPDVCGPVKRVRPWAGTESSAGGGSSAWRWLAVLLGGAGVVHLWHPATFDPIVPELLPGPARAYTYVSGAAELGLALGLVVPRTRGWAGACAALFFVAVFPANVKMAVDAATSTHGSTARTVVTVARLPLQIPLVMSAWRVHRTGRRVGPSSEI